MSHKRISFPSLAMSQLEDEDLVMQIAATLFPGRVDRFPDMNGLRLWVDGDPLAPEAPANEARAIFQTSFRHGVDDRDRGGRRDRRAVGEPGPASSTGIRALLDYRICADGSGRLLGLLTV